MQILFLLLTSFLSSTLARDQWYSEKAKSWYSSQPFIVGSQYITSNAINQLEMWQADSFDSDLIDQELSLAQSLGMTTMRIFLHDLVYSQDPSGFKNRVSTIVEICQKYGLKPIFVFFTTGASQNPTIGEQPQAIPGVRASQFAMSPSESSLANPSSWSLLQTYVKDIIGSFATDSRILAWDLWNMPDEGLNLALSQAASQLLPQVFEWARSANPTQPLTAAVWKNDTDKGNFDAIEQIIVNNSDILTFQNFNNNASFVATINALQKFDRPIIALGYLARSNDNEFTYMMPIAKNLNVGLVNWGFVNGKIQLNLPPDSLQQAYVDKQQTVWYQDLFRNDRTPYLLEDVQYIKHMTSCPNGYKSKVDSYTCYNAYSAPLNWQDAQKSCKNTWSNLVTITSAFENADIQGYVSNETNCDKFYIGLMNTTRYSWKWRIHIPYDNPSYRYPTNNANENCVVLNKAEVTWTNQDCSIPECYICSY